MKPVYLVTVDGMYPDDGYDTLGLFDDKGEALELGKTYKEVPENNVSRRYFDIRVEEFVKTESTQIYYRQLMK